jgi:hypothetical protein
VASLQENAAGIATESVTIAQNKNAPFLLGKGA